ncbi:MAG: hypothetical protein ACK4TA_20550 [Saprospiraceae bacterium]
MAAWIRLSFSRTDNRFACCWYMAFLYIFLKKPLPFLYYFIKTIKK